ncbi:PREDICTED: WAS protein family homolog 1 [Nicrophorus vespilloides]|uniref:WAS protein family homolog 1 n=1 Tax=Nicrophorus vespilloides TaxID=110193 RepID=A0ABM1M7D7_NICVS|nr:PREDICTED: WAS protein family homolog 1 [Nicrophorus vespilloides]
MQPQYEVPLIPQNLRGEENIIQTAEAINYLSDVTTDIFNRVQERIELYKKRIDDITTRINTSSGKLDRLTGAKKATQVFSSSKYPAADINTTYKSIFSSGKPLPIKKFAHQYKNLQIKDEPHDTLQLYHVKVQDSNNKEILVGLGPAPKDIDAVNDMLLYNTGKNLYSNYVHSDSLIMNKSCKEEDIKDVSDIGAAPHSIADKKSIHKPIGETFFYSPDLGNVPTINVPLDLPDLPGIADDLRYETESDPSIAPSIATTPNVPDLPAIVHEDIVLPKIEESVVEKHIEEPKQIELPPVVTPEVIEQPKVVEKVEPPKETVKKTRPDSDARASLMEAIRQAGGTKKLRQAVDVEKSSNTAAPSGGDLMADLHAKLSMRRKGISGNKPAEDLGASSVLNKLSAMIPPPLVNDDSSNRNSDDEWED